MLIYDEQIYNLIQTNLSSPPNTFTSGYPRPEPKPQVYSPQVDHRAAVENRTVQDISSLNNRLDIMKLRLGVLEAAVQELLEGNDYDNGELLKWFKERREKYLKIEHKEKLIETERN